MAETVFVIAAHPDDEILGVGGTLARHARDGDDVHVFILAEGATSRLAERDLGQSSGELSSLRMASIEAAKTIGSSTPHFADFPDNRMDSVDFLDIVKWLEAAIGDVRPTIVYTHHYGDLNVDHGLVHQAVLTAFRPLPDQPTPSIYTFETPSSTEWGVRSQPFVAQHYVNIADTLDVKMAALAHYEMEMRAFPHPRSIEAIEALAKWRGAEIGVPAGEAFGVVRTIRR
ncbi:MAG: GlcNAc-PI de-N-acetylase [Rhodospirillaceae bacterium]|nr:MAG: GlcNAc-PI de-N-acetylase [Rhodospirillaceae bacterium]